MKRTADPRMILVHGNVAAWREPGQRLSCPPREHETGDAGERGQHEPFHHLEPEETGAARAERGADDEVALPADRSREHQVGDVGARDEQHQRHHRGEHRSEHGQVVREAGIRTGTVLRDDQRPRALVLGRVRGGEPFGDDLHLGARPASVFPGARRPIRRHAGTPGSHGSDRRGS